MKNLLFILGLIDSMLFKVHGKHGEALNELKELSSSKGYRWRPTKIKRALELCGTIKVYEEVSLELIYTCEQIHKLIDIENGTYKEEVVSH